MRAYERLLDYVTYETMSDPAAGAMPSSEGQRVLAQHLCNEMQALGLHSVRLDENGYVYGELPATAGLENLPALGFIAHMDTSPDASGTDVRPLLHPAYDGGPVTLPTGRVLDPEKLPALRGMAGQTLITASGDTLLGADDKAGIAEILTACEQLLAGSVPHGRLCIAFTPDEEIGRGADRFDVPGFGAAAAYTVDGGEVGEIEYENFNAASAALRFTGVGVHPGEAKGIMVNAAKLAIEFHGLLPAGECPEQTEGREGFFHLIGLFGGVEQAESQYIIRDHSAAVFARRKAQMQQVAETMQRRYGTAAVQLTLQDSYRNMEEVIRQHFYLVEDAEAAIRAAGLAPITNPIRGGTDGSMLSFKGLPCPNLGTGGFYFHGPSECITAERMDKAVEIILGIVQRAAQKAAPGPTA